jgi:hypothetical protein
MEGAGRTEASDIQHETKTVALDYLRSLEAERRAVKAKNDHVLTLTSRIFQVCQVMFDRLHNQLGGKEIRTRIGGQVSFVSRFGLSARDPPASVGRPLVLVF